MSSVVVHELWYGVATSARRDYNTERAQAFSAGLVDQIEFDAQPGGKALLESRPEACPRPLGAFDHTLVRGMCPAGRPPAAKAADLTNASDHQPVRAAARLCGT